MKMTFFSNIRSVLLLVLACLLGSDFAKAAEPVWHCSRATESVSENDSAANEDSFYLASTAFNREALGISLMDLIDAYSSKPILINGRRLTACFMPGETPLSIQALRSLGLNTATMQLQARKSAIVQSHLHLVTDEAEMQNCIARYAPAVGYLERIINTDQVVPCF